MNFYNIVKSIEQVSTTHKLVNEVDNGDIYEILNSGTHKYPAVVLTVRSVGEYNKDVNTLDFNLFYVDRLLDNSANKIAIQSNAQTVLQQIALKLEETFEFSFTAKSFTFFEEKFADLCAGAYMTASVQYNNELVCSDSEYEARTITLTSNGIYSVIGYDNAIVAVPSEAAVWGGITGTLTDQTDLVQYISEHSGGNLEAGANIQITQSGETKIISATDTTYTAGANVQITGNVISATDTVYDDTAVRGLITTNTNAISTINNKIPNVASQTNKLVDTQTFLDVVSEKQDNLVSGTNIKTINGQSLLGSGDITIGGNSKIKKVSVHKAIPCGKRNEEQVPVENFGGKVGNLYYKPKGAYWRLRKVTPWQAQMLMGEEMWTLKELTMTESGLYYNATISFDEFIPAGSTTKGKSDRAYIFETQPDITLDLFLYSEDVRNACLTDATNMEGIPCKDGFEIHNNKIICVKEPDLLVVGTIVGDDYSYVVDVDRDTQYTKHKPALVRTVMKGDNLWTFRPELSAYQNGGAKYKGNYKVITTKMCGHKGDYGEGDEFYWTKKWCRASIGRGLRNMFKGKNKLKFYQKARRGRYVSVKHFDCVGRLIRTLDNTLAFKYLEQVE